MLTRGFKDVFSQAREKVWGFVVGASGLVISGLPTGLLKLRVAQKINFLYAPKKSHIK